MAETYADISAWQPATIDWRAYKQWSSIVALRSSYGVGYTDAHYQAYRSGAEAAGLRIIHYHYAYPGINSAVDEANWQLKVVGPIGPNDLLMLDYEENNARANAAWALAWLAQQEANYSGKLPLIYASDGYVRSRLQDARLSKYPLVLADWQFSASERPACPPPWTSYIAVQYTDKQTNVPGIAGAIDANVWLGPETAEGDDMAIDINSPNVANYFEEQDAEHWMCKQTKCVVQYAMLTDYKATNGLLHAGLPITNEIPISQFGAQYAALADSGIVVVFYERCVKAYDPSHKIDFPPGAGMVYNVHLYNGGPGTDPLINQLKSQIASLQAQLQSSDPTDAAKLAQIKAIVG